MVNGYGGKRPQYAVIGLVCIDEYKPKSIEAVGDEFTLNSDAYRNFLSELCVKRV